MSPTNPLRRHARRWQILLAVAVALTVFGCSNKPEEPDWRNPFDPNGGVPDPFNLEALAFGNTVVLDWDDPGVVTVVAYNVLYSEGNVVFEVIGAELDVGTTRFTHDTPIANGPNYYKIQAIAGDGSVSQESRVATTTAWTPPYLLVDDGSGKSPSRHLELLISTSTGDSMKIASEPGGLEVVMDAVAGDTLLALPWDLGPTTAKDSTHTLTLIVWTGTTVSDTASREITIDFDPAIDFAGPASTTASPILDLEIEDRGVDWMRFAESEAALDLVAWQPGAPDYTWTSPDLLGTLTVWGEFISDFDDTTRSSAEIDADDLSGAVFTIDSGDLTSGRTVMIRSTAMATEMRFSEAPDFTGAAWVAYADTSWFELSAPTGPKYIYAQFRNYWTESDVSRRLVYLVGDDFDLGFFEPLEGQRLPGGLNIAVGGWALVAGAVPESLAVDLADGDGFRPLTIAREWATDWDTPVVDTDTELTLRLRAFAADDSATASVSVTVLPDPEAD